MQLETSDDHRGLVAAFERHLQGAGWQRCYVHFLRNASGKVARKHWMALASDLKAVYATPYRARALDDVADPWSSTHLAVTRWIEHGIDGTPAHSSFSEAHRHKIRSTNGLERFKQEIECR